jgi:2-phospho-L-lactate guanylyltransferase (CobY/MobA/RfbA family)
MTTIAVLVDPPREGLLLPRLPETSPLSVSEATDLAVAMLADTLSAADRSGGELLVNYRPDDLLPGRFQEDGRSAEAEVRELATGVLDDEPRMEVQVGSTPSARVGNTITHLLDQEEAASAAVVRPNAPFLLRATLDSAAMKLRRSEVVLGPSSGGRVAFAGFKGPIDFEDALGRNELETLTERGLAAGHEVDFLPFQPTIETGSDLATLVSMVRAYADAERIVPAYTANWVEESGLSVVVEEGEARVVRG